MKNKLTFFLSLLLPIQFLLIGLLKTNPVWVEHFYSKGLYPYISIILRSLLGWLPFSVGDLLYACLILGLIRWLYIRIKTKFTTPKRWIFSALATLSIMYGCFNLFWGYNYYRLPLHTSLEIKTDYTPRELLDYTSHLIVQSNKLHSSLTKNDTLQVKFPFTKLEVDEMAIDGYHHITKTFPELTYQQRSLKPSLFSIPLTYMGFNGYLNPLTNEAQYNRQIPLFKLPSTTSHEIGHQLGYAKENEANYMACLTTMNHPDIYMRYAGYTFALQYCLSEVLKTQPCEGENLIAGINLGILKDYREVSLFWETHDNPLEPIFKLFYGNYLKANNQPQGIKSYSYVVALLVNQYHKDLQQDPL